MAINCRRIISCSLDYNIRWSTVKHSIAGIKTITLLSTDFPKCVAICCCVDHLGIMVTYRNDVHHRYLIKIQQYTFVSCDKLVLPLSWRLQILYNPTMHVSRFIIGLICYAFVFAINSSLHSYLVVDLSDHDKVAQDVVFYYMSNACGRLVGVMSGGALYTFYAVDSLGDTHANSLSFTACLWGSAVLAGASTIFATSTRKSPPTDAEELNPITSCQR